MNAIRCLLALLLISSSLRAEETPSPVVFHYVWARAWHILPETTSEESGYFSLCEGRNGNIYIGTAKYGENAYLVEFNPRNEQQRIVIDAAAVTGDPGKGYAAQAKIHTRNFVAPSGVIYCGTKQGYPRKEERDANDIPPYRGGYVLAYDPRKDQAESLGIPWPGFGVIDTVADEERRLVYVVTCEDPYAWMVGDLATRRYRWLGPECAPYATTIVQPNGLASTITWDFKVARYDPAANRLTTQPIVVDGREKLTRTRDQRNVIPYWTLAPDGQSAYFAIMQDNHLYRLDLSPAPGSGTLPVTTLGVMIPGAEATDTRSGITIAPDGRVYLLVKARYPDQTRVHHLVRYDPRTNAVENLGILAVKNPDFYDFGPDGPNASKKFGSHGYRTRPDGTLTPFHNHMGLVAARDGSLYATILYPYTLLRIAPEDIP